MFDVLQLCIIYAGIHIVPCSGWFLSPCSLNVLRTCTFNGELYSCLCFRLSLDVTGFNQQATGAVLDLTADDDEGLGRNKGMKKW